MDDFVNSIPVALRSKPDSDDWVTVYSTGFPLGASRMHGQRAMRRIAAALFDEEAIDQAQHRWALHRRNRGPHADVEATWHALVKTEKV